VNPAILVGLVLFGIAAVALWIHAFRELARDGTFSRTARTAWFVIVLLGPIAGSIAYLSAKRNIKKYSAPDAARLSRLLKHE
jgi:uncharacterized membrane protein (DUF4010 family)